MRKMLGIDVSDNQGYINWAKVKAAGVEFAIMRSVRASGNVDKQLASNIKGCMGQFPSQSGVSLIHILPPFQKDMICCLCGIIIQKVMHMKV